MKIGPETLACWFHEAYERLAPSFGYETRGDTREFDPDSPNGKLMIATCADVMKTLVENEADILPETDVYRRLARLEKALWGHTCGRDS